MHASFGTHHESLIEGKPILSATKMCSPMTLVSDNIRFMRIFAKIPGLERGRKPSFRSSATFILVVNVIVGEL